LPRVTVLKLLRRHWPIVLPAILALAVFHAWVTPGLILGSDWVRRVPDELNAFFPWPPAWNGAQQLGETNEVYLFEFPLFSLMGLFSRLHVSWSVIERVFFFWPYLVLGVAGPYALAIRLTRSSFASAVAASICVVNTWVIMATERGAIPSLIAAALIPLFLLMTLNFIERPTRRRGLAIGLVLTLLLIYDLRYVYISVIMSLIARSAATCSSAARRRRIHCNRHKSLLDTSAIFRAREQRDRLRHADRLPLQLRLHDASARLVQLCGVLPLGRIK
jgi:hypothetical protein